MNREILQSNSRRGRPSVLVLILIKLLQFVLLAAVLCTLAFGVVEAGMSLLHVAKGVPVEGRVTDIYQVEPGSRSAGSGSGGRGARFPVISYSWPPEGGSPSWIQDFIPRSDLSLRDTVTVRVIPGYENLARADRSPLYYVIVGVALLGGLFFTWFMFSTWYTVDIAFGRDAARGVSIFSGLTGKLMIAGVGGPAVMLLLFHFYYVPWMQFNEYVAFFDRPGRLLYLAEERGGPPADGPMNAYERRLLSIPGYGMIISQMALNTAYSLRDTDRILRYIDAIKDPDISFSVDMKRVPSRMMTGPPDVLRRFLDTGIDLPPEVKLAMLDQAEKFRNPERLEILTEYGFIRTDSAP